MKRVLVTGGLGFIGSHTCVELLKKGHDIVVVDNLSNSKISVKDRIKEITGRDFVFIQFDLTDLDKVKEFFEKHSVDSIIHFAASKAVGESVENPIKYYKNNLVSLLNLLEQAKEFAVKDFVFSSSCTVYGQPAVLPVTESTPIKEAESPYGNTKQISEEILQDYCNATPTHKAISLRYFNPIGAHDSALIGELPLGVPNNLGPVITQTAAGIREKLLVFGDDYDTPDGTCIRDYIHVVDLAEAHIAALEHLSEMNENYDFFNVGNGKGHSVLEVIKSFERIANQKLTYEIVDRRPGDVEKIYADTTKINQVLGWNATLELDDMIRSAWNWQKTIKRTDVSV